jgi:hypothetical protein
MGKLVKYNKQEKMMYLLCIMLIKDHKIIMKFNPRIMITLQKRISLMIKSNRFKKEMGLRLQNLKDKNNSRRLSNNS